MRPLAGVRVLDLTRLLPGPYASRLLVDLGADVIKVEDPGPGDYLRTMQPAWFAWLNRGKRSVQLDLKRPEGRAAFLRLCRSADAVLEGFRPGVLERLGLGYGALQEQNQRLVLVSLCGFDPEGPDQNRAGHDLNYLAAAGLLGLMPPGPDGAPANPPLQMGDTGGGLMAAFYLVSGILHARATGTGAHLYAPIAEALRSLGGYLLAEAERAGCLGRDDLFLAGGRACYRSYLTADGGAVSLGALEPKFWAAFCTAAGRPDLAPRQFDPDQEALAAEVAALFRSRPLADWAALAAETPDACLYPVLRPEQVPPPAAAGAPAPAPGAHTRGVLQEAGYTDAELQALAAAGAAVLP